MQALQINSRLTLVNSVHGYDILAPSLAKLVMIGGETEHNVSNKPRKLFIFARNIS